MAKPGTSSTLKKDNVAPEEVVKVIKDLRTKQRIKYAKYTAPNDLTKGTKGVRAKLAELEGIFSTTSNEMEWEAIRSEALQVMGKEEGIKDDKEIKEWALKQNNFLRLSRKIISLAEQNQIVLEYTTLNQGFTKRLKDENRNTDVKTTGDKRPLPEPDSETESESSVELMNDEELKEYQEKIRDSPQQKLINKQNEMIARAMQKQIDEGTW
jgi:hypothetical protein